MNNFYTITTTEKITDPFERAKYIGGSDVPVIVGCAPTYDGKPTKTLLDIWNAKQFPENVKQFNTHATSWGHDHEGNILKKFLFYRYGSSPKITAWQDGEWQEAVYPNGTKCIRFAEITHPEHIFLKSHPDLVVIESESAGGEIYTTEAKSHRLMAAKRTEENDPRTGYDFNDRLRGETELYLPTYIQSSYNTWIADCASQACGGKPITKYFVTVLYDTNQFCIFGNKKMPDKIDTETGEVLNWAWKFPGLKQSKKALEKIQSAVLNFEQDRKAGLIPEITPYDVGIKKVEKKPKTITGDAMIEAKIQINNYHRANAMIKSLGKKKDDISSALKMLMGYDPEKPLEINNLIAANLLRAADGEELAIMYEVKGSYKFNSAEQKAMQKEEPELWKNIVKYLKKGDGSIVMKPKKIGE